MNVEKEDLSAFQCRRCGACCKWEGPVRVTEQEIDAIADYLGIELQRFIRDYTYLTPERRLCLRRRTVPVFIMMTAGNVV